MLSNLHLGLPRSFSPLRHCATSWKIAGSITNSVIRIFHLGAGIDLASDRNEIFPGGESGRCVWLTTYMCRLPQGLYNNFFGFALHRMSVKFWNILLFCGSRINYTPRLEEFHFKLIFLAAQGRCKTLLFIAQWCPRRKCYNYLNKSDADCTKALHLDYNFTSLQNELSRNSDFLGAFP